MKLYSEEFETNGVDHNYEVIHFLGTKNVMVQLIDCETGTTVNDDRCIVTRNTESTVLLNFLKVPKNKTKFSIMIMGF